MYRVHGLLPPGTDFTLEEAHRRLAAKFPQYVVLLGTDQITVESGDWEFEWRLLAGPDVAQENFNQIALLPGYDANQFVGYDRRVELWTDTPDPEMAHFGDFQGMVEVLKSFTGVLAIDPKEPGVM